MSDAPPSRDRDARRPPGRWRRRFAVGVAIALAAAVLLLIAVLLLRGYIARQALEAWLSDMGVDADVNIARVGPGGAKGGLVLGDKGSPDLVVGDVELDYDVAAPWFGRPGGVTVRAVRLRDVVLRARLKDGGVSFGKLDELIAKLTATPSAEPTPLPDIDLQRGAILLATDAGPLRIDGSGLVKDGALQRFDGVLAPAVLRQNNMSAQISGGRVTLRRTGSNLVAGGHVALTKGRFADATLGLATLDLAANGRAVADGGFQGRVRLDLAGAEAASGARRLQAPRLSVEIPSLSVRRQGEGFASSGAAVIQAGSSALSADGVQVAAPQATLTIDRHSAVWDGTRHSIDATYALDAQAASLTGGDLALRATRASAIGALKTDGGGLSLTAFGSASSRGRLSEAAARRWATTLPLVAQEPAYRVAFLRAARDFSLNVPAASVNWNDGAMRVGLARPATLRSASGGALTVAGVGKTAVYAPNGGALNATLAGGGLPSITAAVSEWSWRGETLDVRAGLRAAFDLTPLDDVTVNGAGRLRMVGDAVSVTAERCFDVTARRLALDANTLTDIAGKACPAGGPLFTLDGGRWRAQAAFRDARFVAGAAQARVAGASGTLDLREAAGVIRVARADITDLSKVERFAPLRLAGTATQRGQLWTAVATAALPSGQALVAIDGRHDLTTGAGSATFDTGLLTFAEPGLQPTQVTPAARLAGRVVGRARFEGRAAWSAQALESSGRLLLDGLEFDSPAGRVSGAAGDIAFTSLAPLRTAEHQTVRASQVALFLPLTDVAADFTLEADRLRVDSATGRAAGGVLSLDPMSVTLATGDTKGALVLDDIDLNQFIAATNLGEKIRLEAIVDGRLPFRVEAGSVRIDNGALQSVRPGRLYIARDMLGGVSTSSSPGAPAPETVNAIQDFAYQAMENLAFDTLSATVNSQPDGRLGLLFQVKGHHEPEVAERARLSFFDVLRGRAFERRIPLPKGTPIELTLDSSLNFDELVAAYADAWRRRVEETP